MRRWLLVISVVVLAAALWRWFSRPTEPEAATAPEPSKPEFPAVDVRASSAAQALTLTGVVKGPDGQSLAGAEVFLAASTQTSLTELRCGVCAERLLSCPAAETAKSVAHLLEHHQGEQRPALSTRADAEGRFRFEGLGGISFTVWGRADGYGEGIKERAAPGDPVELYLPVARTLRGRLLNEEGRGISGTVRVTSRRLATIHEQIAGPDGHFEVPDLGEGPFAVSAVAPGFLPVLNGEAEAGADALTLTLPSPRKLQVRVLADGQPVDATLLLEGDHLSRRLAVKNGTLTVEELYPGSLMATATAGSLSSVPQRVNLQSASTDITLVLERGGGLAVTVVDDVGEPVKTPTLELLTWAQERIATRKTDTGAVTLFGPLASGEYQLRATASEYRTMVVPVKVSPGETPIEITMTRGLVISGRVVDEYGRPAPGVSVLVTPTGDAVLADGEGRFVAPVPSAGLYQLHAHHSDWGGGEMKVQAPKEGVELQLEPKAQAQVIVSVEGRRLEGASVTLFHALGNFRSDRPSGPDGMVLMRGLPEDSYTLVASHPDYLPSDRQPLQLRDGELKRVTAELKVGGKIEGQVVDTMGLPITGVTVAVTPRGTEPAAVDAQGHFVLSPLRPNVTYGLQVIQKGFEPTARVTSKPGAPPVRIVLKRQPVFRGRVLGEGQPLKSFRIDEHQVTSPDGRFELPLPATEDRVILAVEALGYEPLMVDRPNVPDLGDLELQRAPLVSGVVHDEGGAPVVDAVVGCDLCEQSVLSGADGRFSFGKPPFQREFTVVAKKGRRTATKTVSDGAPSNLDLVLKAGVKVTGLAYLPSGQPAAGLEIAGINVDRGETLSAVTQADGSYELEVSPGFYRFALALPNSQSSSEDPLAQIIEVTPATNRLDFGPVPGRAVLAVRVKPQPGYALWLVRGELAAVGNPPMELLRVPWAQLVYQPRTDRVVFGALDPGRYTLVWASFHADAADGPLVMPVMVPNAQEISLTR